jgi:hypothetical protein
MTVRLTPRGEELLAAALSRGVGRSPEEVIERALETASGIEASISARRSEDRREAVAKMMAFHDDFHLNLSPGETVRNLIHEARKY